MGRELVLSILALAVVAAVGGLALWTPFGVDQAIFVYGAEAMASGAVLYRDFWDIKPPGIFGFYALAGTLFAFDEVGIHLAELFWQLLLALMLLRVARLCVDHPLAALVAPLAAVGSYYVFGDIDQLTQVEALVGMPVVASLFLVYRLCERGLATGGGLLLGAAIGLIAIMKPIYSVLPVAFIAAALPTIRRRSDSAKLGGSVRGLLGSVIAGISLIWIPWVGYFLYHGTFHDFVWTTFVYPSQALREVPSAPTERLVSSVAWLSRVFAPYLPLLIVGIGAWRRHHRTVLRRGVALYIALAATLLLVQRISWWEYHFVLLLPPLALLASLGLDRILGILSTARLPSGWVAGLVCLLLILPALDLTSGVMDRSRRLNRALNMDTDARLPLRLDPQYLKIWFKTEFLRQPTQSVPGSVYVFGDFRNLLLSGRRQAIAVHGHAWHHLPRHLWSQQAERLVAAKPAYLYVGGFYRAFLRHNLPTLWRHIESAYKPIRRQGRGRWYQRRERPPLDPTLPMGDDLRAVIRSSAGSSVPRPRTD